jgi:hypothetical protein
MTWNAVLVGAGRQTALELKVAAGYRREDLALADVKSMPSDFAKRS